MTPSVQWLAGLIALGFVLLAIEVFLPGAVLGIIGAVSLFAAVVYAFVAIGPTGGLVTLGAVLLLSLPAVLAFIPFIPPTEIGAVQQIIYGLAMTLLMIFRPAGLVGDLSRGKSTA